MKLMRSGTKLSVKAAAFPLIIGLCLMRAIEVSGADEKFLFVWAGDQARQAPDFLAVVDFDENSAGYGNVIKTVPLPAPGETGNEPHHVGLSKDGNVLGCGGLLSVLKGQKEVFFFDVSDPNSPKFMSAADPPQSAITDDFYPLSGGGFLVTMMGGGLWATPRAEWRNSTNSFNWWQSTPTSLPMTDSTRTGSLFVLRST